MTLSGKKHIKSNINRIEDSNTDAHGIDMLNGSIGRSMLLFALPLIASGVLQQSFNAVDIAVVGQFCSKHSLAAVGSNGMIVSLLLNLFIGISVGANVVIANAIGRRDEAAAERAARTAMAVAFISGGVLLVIGWFAARPLLQLMDTPDEIIDLSTRYLQIFFLGMPFMMAYNFGAAILRSKGDTKRPFLALLCGGIVNVCLNIVLVAGFDMDVAGVGIATVVANGVNAAIIIEVLAREKGAFRVPLRSARVYMPELRSEMRIGIPAGLQGMVFSVSNVFVQTAINRLGPDAVAGSAVAVNFEAYCYYFVIAIVQAVVAFTAQNYGAGDAARCRRVFRIGMLMAVVACGVPNVVCAFFARSLAGLFTAEPGVIEFAMQRMHYVLVVQWVACSYEIGCAAMRGLGYSLLPTGVTVAGTCLLRVAGVQLMFMTSYSFLTVMSLYPLTWCLTGILALATYRVVARRAFRNLTSSAPEGVKIGDVPIPES